MKYPCGIIKDLLPLYIDDIASTDTKMAVETHMAECENCREYYESMRSTNGFTGKKCGDPGDAQMADSLKKIKLKIDRKIRKIILCAASAALILVIAFQILFNLPVKTIGLSDIRVTVDAYPMAEIASAGSAGPDSVKITAGETDGSEIYRLEIPAMPNADISVTKDIIDHQGFVSVITWNSPYQIREIKYADDNDEKTIYVESFRTTLLNNRMEGNLQSVQNLEFREVDRIVFVGGGQQVVLWSK